MLLCSRLLNRAIDLTYYAILVKNFVRIRVSFDIRT